MVKVAGIAGAGALLRRSLTRLTARILAVLLLVFVFYGACTTRVRPNEWGVEQRKFGFKRGIVDRAYAAGLYFVGPGATMHTFPREIHLLEASYDRQESEARARRMGGDIERKVDRYFERRDVLLGGGSTHRVIDALNVQTSDGYAVTRRRRPALRDRRSGEDRARVRLGLALRGRLRLNTFRNGVLTTLGKMNAEAFYDETLRIQAVNGVEAAAARSASPSAASRWRSCCCAATATRDNYEKSLQDKKVAVQLAEKNRKEGLANEERAKLQQLESKGNANITIAESEVAGEDRQGPRRGRALRQRRRGPRRTRRSTSPRPRPSACAPTR